MYKSVLDMALEMQKIHGYVTEADMQKIAEETGTPVNLVYETLSFYSMILLEAPAKIRIEVCRGTSCHNAGGKDLIKEIEEIIGCAIGSSNAQYAFDYCECLGRCETAPNVMVNDKLYTSVTLDSIKAILKEVSC